MLVLVVEMVRSGDSGVMNFRSQSAMKGRNSCDTSIYVVVPGLRRLFCFLCFNIFFNGFFRLYRAGLLLSASHDIWEWKSLLLLRWGGGGVEAQLRSEDINMGTVIIIIRADGLPGDCLVFRANQGSFLELLKILQCLLVAIDGLLG